CAEFCVFPWRRHTRTGGGPLGVDQVRQDGRLEPVSEGGALPAGSKVAFGVSSEREASVVVLALHPRRVVLASPAQAATGAIERIQPGSDTMLAAHPAIEGPPRTVRFLAAFPHNPPPP